MERLRGLLTFRFSILMTTLNYILLDNYCPCFILFSNLKAELRFILCLVLSFRPLKSIISQVGATTIDPDNLIKVMGAVEVLEKLDTGKDISVKLESRCKEIAISNLRSVNTMGKFVTDNCDNIDLVMRLFHTCEGLFKEPQPAKLVEEPIRCEHFRRIVTTDGRTFCLHCRAYLG